MLFDTEQQQLRVQENGVRRDYPLNRCLHEFIETQVEGNPDADAVIFEDKRLTYRQLNARANQLARHLQTLGVGPDVLVGICLERSLEMVVGLLAILKAGGAYVPIDPGYPEARLAFMLADASPAVLLSQERFRDKLPEHSAQTLFLDTDWPTIAEHRHDNPVCKVTADKLAYVIYTSGSTGEPKGAMNTHRAVVNRLLWMQEAYSLAPGDAVLQKTPFSFDVSVWEFFWPLMTGARLVLARPEGHKDSAYLVNLIKDQQISVLHFVPSMLYLFLEETDLRAQCASLRHVICSGEALPFDLQERFFARIDAQLHNLYGPTEAAVDVTRWTCRRGAAERVVPIGYPVANTQLYILSETLNAVAPGTTGELHIGGVQVARGYHNRPELTAEKFIPDPFSKQPGARLYKTGDLARFRPDGALEFLGRLDHQVKVRGFRVELGEIEAVLAKHPAVKQTVVIAAESPSGDKRLIAYVVPYAEAIAVDELRHYLGSKLPDYMLPSSFVLLETMPLTPNGKVDRRKLPEPERKRPELEQAYAAPRNALETFLSQLWAETLELDKVGVFDKFFELGGTSLQAARFVNRLQKELGEFIYVVTIFEAPSVAEYAAMLRRDYPAALARRFGEETPESSATSTATGIDAATIERFQQIIPRLSQNDSQANGSKNPPAIFILAPPRSGTTLLRVMLAGHPQLFAAAELQLLPFNTLQERKEAFSGKFSLWLEGTIRAIMELKGCDADEAKRLMASYESKHSTKAFYRELQSWLEGRTLIDKSPHYALEPACLQKAERDFDNAIYIHLTRHPYAMVRSFESYHMEQVLFLHEHNFSSRQLGELVWTVSQQNILNFLDSIPSNRHYRLSYETLVSAPETTMKDLCEHLNLPYHAKLVNPYEELEGKMTDGIHADSTPMGDTRLLERQAIDPRAADSWKAATADDLSELSWQVASSLGYERPSADNAEPVRQRTSGSGRLGLHRQRRLKQRSAGHNNEADDGA